MEDNFRVRVDRIFGSLSSSSSPNPSSLWSLTDDEIERNEWNRDKDEAEPGTEPDTSFANRLKNKSDDFGAELEKDLLDLDDETQARESRGSSSHLLRGDDFNDEEWEIKSNIGADCTLDYEEEEDRYDKQAIGKEKKPEERLYMKDVNDYVTDACSFDELPESFRDVARDPRANHIAAKLRLKEDAEAAKKIDSLRVSEKEDRSVTDAQTNISGNGNLKPILKRGDTQPDSKPRKRVRFDPECKDYFDDKSKGEEALDSTEVSASPADYPSGIPDYMRNPSKYTRYTFDLEDMDDKSNKQAYMDFLKMIKKSDTTESLIDESFELPKTVTFVPKRKTGDIAMAENDTKTTQNQDDTIKESGSGRRRGLPISITVGDEEEVCAMDEDEPETIPDKIVGSQKLGRRYRMKDKMESE